MHLANIDVITIIGKIFVNIQNRVMMLRGKILPLLKLEKGQNYPSSGIWKEIWLCG